MSRQSHDLEDFMLSLTGRMSDEYDRIQKRVKEDPGTAGDQGEENWAALLRDWLPRTYEVVTKGRILSHEGAAGPQVDILVLDPSYPRMLLANKLYLAAGVAAAFECKVTLRSGHIADAVRKATEIRRLLPQRTGSPFLELHSPILYGLLAHSHQWKSDKAKPLENVENHLKTADEEYVRHPREMLDLICVSDLATLAAGRNTWLAARPDYPEFVRARIAEAVGPSGAATSGYLTFSKRVPGQKRMFTPIGAMVTYTIERLAWEDPSARRLARYFHLANIPGSGQGWMRAWGEAIYSEPVAARVKTGPLANGEFWNEWSVGFT